MNMFSEKFKGKRLTIILLVLSGAVSTALYILMASLSPPFEKGAVHPSILVALLTSLFIILVMNLVLVKVFENRFGGEGENRDELETVISHRNRMRYLLVFVLVVFIFGFFFRVILLESEPLLDNDAYRFFWEGRVMAEGKSPYKLYPMSRELGHMRDEYYDRVGYKQLASCYPPAAEYLFLGAYKIAGGDFLTFKKVLAIFDFINIFLVFYLLKLIKKPLHLGLLYAWNPLVIKEFANSGHYDAAAVTFLILAIILIIKKKEVAASVFLGICIALKPFALIAAPLLLFRGRKTVVNLLIMSLVISATLIPFAGELKYIADGLGVYAQYWEYNSGPFLLFKGIAGLFTSNPLVPAKKALSVFLFVLLGYFIYRLICLERDKKSAEDMKEDGNENAGHYIYRLYFSFIVLGMALLFNPVVNPWYIAWIIPFILIYPSWAWIYFLWSVNLSYYFTGHSFAEPLILVVEFLPVIILWGFEIYDKKRSFISSPELNDKKQVNE